VMASTLMTLWRQRVRVLFTNFSVTDELSDTLRDGGTGL